MAQKTASGVEALSAELEYFRQHKVELLAQHSGKFALIKDHEFVGAFDDAVEALREGIRRFGDNPFLIRQIVDVEQTANVPALTLGIINAHS